MSTSPITKDYFFELSKLISNQLSCATILAEYFENQHTLSKEKTCAHLAKEPVEEIFFQKRQGILPASKELYCLRIAELVFQSQMTLLHIPELFRIYHAEHLIPAFEPFTPVVNDCCEKIKSFSLPCFAKDRFLPANADPVFEACLEGFKTCRQICLSDQTQSVTSFESLCIKDIDEEFASFFLINLKFVHCALHFPM